MDEQEAAPKPKIKIDKIDCNKCEEWTRMYGCACGEILCRKCFLEHSKACKWAWEDAK